MELISKEEVRKCFNGTVKTSESNIDNIKEYLQGVCTKIEELPTVELKGSFKPDGEYEYIITQEKLESIYGALKELFRPKGKWIKRTEKIQASQTAVNFMTYYECSECGAETDTAREYCAWCGAEMESE